MLLPYFFKKSGTISSLLIAVPVTSMPASALYFVDRVMWMEHPIQLML